MNNIRLNIDQLTIESHHNLNPHRVQAAFMQELQRLLMQPEAQARLRSQGYQFNLDGLQLTASQHPVPEDAGMDSARQLYQHLMTTSSANQQASVSPRKNT